MLLLASCVCCFLLHSAWISVTTLSGFRSRSGAVDLLVFSLYIVSFDKQLYVKLGANWYRYLVGLVWHRWSSVLAQVYCIVDLTVGIYLFTVGVLCLLFLATFGLNFSKRIVFFFFIFIYFFFYFFNFFFFFLVTMSTSPSVSSDLLSCIVPALSTQAPVSAPPTLTQSGLVMSLTALALHKHHTFHKNHDIILRNLLL